MTSGSLVDLARIGFQANEHENPAPSSKMKEALRPFPRRLTSPSGDDSLQGMTPKAFKQTFARELYALVRSLHEAPSPLMKLWPT